MEWKNDRASVDKIENNSDTPEKKDFNVNHVDEPADFDDNGTDASEGLGSAAAKASDFGESRDKSPDIMDKLGKIDSNLQALQDDLQNNTDSVRDGNDKVVALLNRTQEDLRFIKNAIRLKTKDGRERGVANIVSDVLNKISDVLSKLSKPTATADGLLNAKTDVINKITEARNSLKNDLRDGIKYDLRNELNGKIREIRTGVEQIAKGLQDNLKKELGNISGNIQKLQKEQQILTQFVEEDFQATLKQELKPLKTLETASGQLGQLQEGIDAVSQTLSDKGLQLRQKFPAANTDEEVLCNLTEYGHTILTQLSVAARWYARSKAELDNLETIKDQAEKEYTRGYTEGKTTGETDGKRALIRELFSRFGDGETLLLHKREGFDPMAQLQILADFLQSEGLHRGYAPGDIVEVNEDNYAELAAHIKDLPHSSVRIVKSDYYLNDELLQKAECEPLSQADAAQ